MNTDRVCLIISPSIFLLDERVFMTLGILKVAAVLEESGVIVEMLDLSGVENYEDAVRDYVVSSELTWYGLSATTPQMPAATKIYNIIRQVKPHAKVILGGPHATLVNAAYKKEQKRGVLGRAHKSLNQLTNMFDSIVTGDGEIAIFETLKESFPKLIDGDDPSTDLFLNNKMLNSLPFPARHLVDVNSYHYQIDGHRALSLIAQLGCPFGCGFCGGRFSPSLRRIRMRTSENIIQEMTHIYKTYGVTGFMFYDDELNVNTKIVELMNMIADAQKQLNVEFRLRGFVKSELFTEEQAEVMYRAGFRWLLVGFESGHDRILTNIQKKASQSDNTKAMRIAKKYGLKVKALMSVGHPGESEETIKTTRDWLVDVKPDDFDATVITTYPGSPYFDEAVETKPGVWTYTCPKSLDRIHSLEVDYREVAEYYKGVPGEYISYIHTDYLDSSELVQHRDWLESSVRKTLNIPYNVGLPAQRYEHTMGQHHLLPKTIFNTTARNNS